MKTVLVVKTGSTHPDVRRAHGDYDRWFVEALGVASARWSVAEVHLGAPLPERGRGVDAVVVTGSPRSVTERAPWMRRTAAWLRSASERVPVLGVCFGHQLLAEAFGGEVARNPSGREIGTVRCTLTRAGASDPLFAGVPASFAAQATHEDAIVRMPPGAEVLATSDATEVQAFRIGGRVRAVQFHPEMDASSMRALAVTRREVLLAEARGRGEDPEASVRALLAGIAPSPCARRVLANFLEFD
jgi:GMP synthase (glutamine-hydrolysing)